MFEQLHQGNFKIVKEGDRAENEETKACGKLFLGIVLAGNPGSTNSGYEPVKNATNFCKSEELFGLKSGIIRSEEPGPMGR
jgi:hypothetical protein